jgi:hypothetical protein
MPVTNFAITSIDPGLPRRLLGVNAEPETAREIHNAGVVLYRGASNVSVSGRMRHAFTVEFGSENAAGAVANWMWTALHGHVSTLDIGGEDVPVQNGAIKRALLVHADAV